MKWPPPLGLNVAQLDRLAELERLALQFNAKLNLYSQASTEAFRERHIAHSLALATRSFPPDSVVADWGTGGGMPGLVLAIAFPETLFHLVDSVGKKIRAVQTMARRLGLDNVTAHHVRAEEWPGLITHSVSRATSPLATLWTWHERVCEPMASEEGQWHPGLICLKGGRLEKEIETLRQQHSNVEVEVSPLPDWLSDSKLEEKVVVEVRMGVSHDTP